MLKCPICGAELIHIRGDLCKCSQCLFAGDPKNITELKRNIRKIDAIIKIKEDEMEYLLDARREAILKGNAVYLRQVLNDISLTPSQANSSSYPTVAKTLSSRNKLGLMIASLELGAFLSWLIDNCYELTSGNLPLVQTLIPFIILFQAIILLAVSWE